MPDFGPVCQVVWKSKSRLDRMPEIP
jgi:hypothetical protein